MSELTKEYFDQQIAKLSTKDDLNDAVEALARIIAETIAEPFTKRFDRLEDLLTVKDEVEKLKTQMIEIRSALHLST